MDVGRAERDLDLGDDSAMSNEEHSDREDEARDCDSSDEGAPLNSNMNGTAMDYGRNSDDNSDIPLGHHPQFPSNHTLGLLSNFMGVPGLQNLPSLQHGDVLEKLKMQVRDMKVGLMEQDYPAHTNFSSPLPSAVNSGFSLPQPMTNGINQPQNLTQSQNSISHSNGFPFTSPNAPSTKDANPGSNSSSSSEASNSSQQNNGYSFEEQYKQVRQLYEINDDPKRKEFLDDLFSYMQKRGTPINRLPIMAKSVLDLYELYNLVIARGGLVDVINKKLWQEIIKGLHLPSSITSAAFTLRTQYMKYLYPYECEKKNLSTPAELQAAIDGNRREGRRSSYGPYDGMQNQLQMPQVQRPPVPNNMQQMSPLALVAHGNSQSAHHRMLGPHMNQIAISQHDIEQRMLEYLKLFQPLKDAHAAQNPNLIPQEALNALEMSRVALWSLYNNNTSPPASINPSPPGHVEPQREALNLSESPPSISIKRERERERPDIQNSDKNRDFIHPPPAKRGFPASYHMSIPNLPEEDREDVPDHMERNARVDFEVKSSVTPPPVPPNGVSDNCDFPLLTGMQFKLSRRGNGTTGDHQLVVNLELNGVHYEGVLFANPSARSSPTANTSKASANDTNSSLDERTHSIVSS